jgi:hypothetical protein
MRQVPPRELPLELPSLLLEDLKLLLEMNLEDKLPPLSLLLMLMLES